MPINSVVLILNCKLKQVFMLRVYQFLTEKQISALEDLENLSSNFLQVTCGKKVDSG